MRSNDAAGHLQENPPIYEQDDDHLMLDNYVDQENNNETGKKTTMDKSKSLMELMAENSILRKGDMHIEIQDLQLTRDPQLSANNMLRI